MSDSDGGPDAPSGTDAMVKKLVRLALSSEYSRLPIRRGDISAKVLGEQGSRQSKIVFETAQKQLRTVFGMELTELPAREKVTVAQRRGEFASLLASRLLKTHTHVQDTCLPGSFSCCKK